MSPTREDYELAAKDAGIVVVRSRLNDPLHNDMLIAPSVRNPYQHSGPWNPLADDGDSRRLQVAIGCDVYKERDTRGEYWQACHYGTKKSEYYEIAAHIADHADSAEAMRAAVFKLAFKIGRGMP
jgi:hypothetical protein